MNRRQMLLLMGNRLNLPYSIDFSGLSDGPLPPKFLGPTWSIVSGKAVNTPTLNGELLADPGLEATYTDGKCDTLLKGGTPTLSESSEVHGGSKAQDFTAGANNDSLKWAGQAGIASVWYQVSGWVKRLAGTASQVFLAVYTGGAGTAFPSNITRLPIKSATYTQKKLNFIPLTTGLNYVYPTWQIGATGNDNVLVDDISLQRISNETLFSLLPSSQPDVVIKVRPDTLVDSTCFGMVLRAEKQFNPNNYVIGICRLDNTEANVNFMIIKCVSGLYTIVLAETAKAIVADAWFELRGSGSSISVWYNNLQVGTTQTISDAEILSNRHHGVISGGSNKFKNFFLSTN